MKSSTLSRTIRSASPRPPAATCDLCGEHVASAHRHLWEVEARQVRCVCPACSVLFGRAAASEGRYRLVSERRRRVEGVDTGILGVPVGLAFFVVGADGNVSAHYPSPAGATRWEVDRAAWQQAVDGCPALAELEPEVEALLVNLSHGRRHEWLVPIDDCFRLVAIVRQEWRGLSGGSSVWPAIDAFFEGLQTHSEGSGHGADPCG